MEFVMSFVNILIVPYIACALWRKRKKQDIKFSAELLYEYARFVTSIVVVTRIVLYLVKRTLGIGVETYSWEYTLVASLFAHFIPVAYEIIEKYIEVKIEVKKANK